MALYEKACLANVPIAMLTKKLSDFGVGQEENPAIQDLKVRWTDLVYDIPNSIDGGRVIFVSGDNGTGKTMMSCILLKSGLNAGISSQYLLFNDLINIYLSKDNEKEDKMEYIHSCGILAIDELGKQYKKATAFGGVNLDFARYVLENTLKMRSDCNLTTLLISNDTLDDVIKQYGGVGMSTESLLKSDKLVEFCHAGIDFRRAKA